MSAISQPPLSSDEERDFEKIYVSHFGFLLAVAIRKFRVPESEAETLVHDVFLSYVKRSEEVVDIHAWLLGGICHASRYYWRLNGRGGTIVEIDSGDFEQEDPSSSDIHDLLPNQIAARAALDSLPKRYAEILRLRFYDGFSINEIAQKLGVKPKYAQKLVTKCLRRAEKTYFLRGQKPHDERPRR